MPRKHRTTSVRPRREDEFGETQAGEEPGQDARRMAEQFPPGSSIGRYVVLGEIGAGGMGVVFAAFDPELNRRVALKILLPKASRRGRLPAPSRLMREAQAIARLSHPNVVNVYDVGRHGDAVFVAMEFVEGQTLAAWLREGTRTLRAILDAFAHAGRGLAAAHTAGLIHRDFKPENVLVSPDGRVRVLDFGLARADPTRPGSIPSIEPEGEPGVPQMRYWSDSDVLNSPLTRDDAVVGTPRYMAPEQHAGIATDARSDQFAFCVALYQALYGQDPFDATTLQELAEQKQDGRVKNVPPGVHVPLWVEEAVLRGLSANPADRWASMDALVAVLERDPRASRRRWWALVGGTGGLVIVTAAIGWQRAGEDVPCRGAAQALEGVWDEGRRDEVEQAITATKLPYASHTWTEVRDRLDDYAAAWTTMRAEACEATRVRGEQSDDLLALRVACLDRRLAAMRALVDVMRHADEKVVERGIGAATALPPVGACADVDALQAGEATPSEERHVAKTIAEKLAQVQALRSSGKFQAGLELATEALADAEALGQRGVWADALEAVGRLQEHLGQYAQAERSLKQAVWTATRGGHDERVASAATTLVSVVGDRLARHEEGLLWGEHALAVLDRLEVEGLPRAQLANNLGNVLYRKHDFTQAGAKYAQALALVEREFGVDDARAGQWRGNLGNLQMAQNQLDAALETFQHSQRIIENALGMEHPSAGVPIASIGIVYERQGRHLDAQVQFERALPMFQRSMGERHPYVGSMHLNLGDVLVKRDKLDEAIPNFQAAMAIFEESVGRDHPNVGLAHAGLGRIYGLQEQYDAARRHHARALQIREQTFGAEHSEVAASLVDLANIDLALGEARRAVERLQRAVAMYEASEGSQRQAAEAHFALARALWDAGQSQVAARAQAQLALDLVARRGDEGTADAVEIEAWMRDHRVAEGTPPPPPSAPG